MEDSNEDKRLMTGDGNVEPGPGSTGATLSPPAVIERETSSPFDPEVYWKNAEKLITPATKGDPTGVLVMVRDVVLVNALTKLTKFRSRLPLTSTASMEMPGKLVLRLADAGPEGEMNLRSVDNTATTSLFPEFVLEATNNVLFAAGVILDWKISNWNLRPSTVAGIPPSIAVLK